MKPSPPRAFVPAFIFVQIVSSPLRVGMALRVMAFTLCIVAGMFAMSALAARIGGYSAAERRSLQLATMFYNSGNYGIPLMTLAFPGSGPVLRLRLAAGPLLALLLVPVFGFQGESAGVMILSSAFPTAVNTALLAHEFRADANFAAAVVFYSTLGSMFTVFDAIGCVSR